MASLQTTRRPDSISASLTLDEHVAMRNPHPEYILRTELGDLIAGDINISTLLTFITDLDSVNVAGSKKIVDAYTIKGIDSIATAANTQANNAYSRANDAYALAGEAKQIANSAQIDITNHRYRYTQAAALNDAATGNLTDHLDNEGYNLYAARTHTHTPTSLGAALEVHSHVISDVTGLQGVLNGKFDADYAPFDLRYYTRSELGDVGIYPESVSNDPGTYDFNNYTTQGTYYFTTTNTILNGPDGATIGTLIVYSVDSSSHVTQVMYTKDMSWKRTGDVVNSVMTWSDWTPLVETAPIGSLMFSNRSDVPAGYVEADGSSLDISAYPTLWKFAVKSGALVSNANRLTGGYIGCFGLGDTISLNSTRIADITLESSSFIDKIYIEDDTNHFVLLTEALHGQITANGTAGNPRAYFSADALDPDNLPSGAKFILPNLGGSFMQMWTKGVTRDFGTYEEAGLPNITGSFDGYELAHYDKGATTGGAFGYERGAYNGTKDYAGTSIKFTFDASQSNSIYGNSDTVTPDNITVRVFIKAYNGSLLGEDADRSSIESIINTLMSSVSYATTDVSGIVRLATDAIARGDVSDVASNKPSVITAAQLIDKDSSNVKKVIIDSKEYVPGGNILTLPSFAEAEGNRTIVVESVDNNPIKCLAIDTTDLYTDFVIPENVLTRYGTNSSDIESVFETVIAAANVSVFLKCISGQNNMGYPVGAKVLNPMCSTKVQTNSEYLSAPSTVIFEDNITYAQASLGSSSTNSVIEQYEQTYILTEDDTFVANKTYYTQSGSNHDNYYVYTVATVTVGDPVAADTYYEQSEPILVGGGTSNIRRIIVRLYWPTVWFVKRFTPTATDGSTMYPLKELNESASYDSKISGIANECNYWTAGIVLKF